MNPTNTIQSTFEKSPSHQVSKDVAEGSIIKTRLVKELGRTENELLRSNGQPTMVGYWGR